MKLSKFGKKITRGSGIGQLMDDLGNAIIKGREIIMLGGGNPAHIPAVQQVFRNCMNQLLEKDGAFEHAIGDYDTPQGNLPFIEALARLLSTEYGWDIKPANIALTNGSQTAFFILFNMFAGEFDDGSRKKILLPLAPEYIGYDDVGLVDDFFVTSKPIITHFEDRIFKYHVDFKSISEKARTEDIGAICVSRPTNPTGNVLTDEEIGRLSAIAGEKNIPFIIDNAYGMPCPNIIFTDAKPAWNPQTILCMTLSKLGLPATRTGIVIANEDIISAISGMNAVLGLAPTSVGASLATGLVNSGDIIRLSQNVIKPFYESKVKQTVEQAVRQLQGIDFYIHRPEGAIFIWIWFKDLPITSLELYNRLKQRGVLVLPSQYFYPGLRESWQHKHECIRVTYAQDQQIVNDGLKIIAEEVKRAYNS